MTLSTMLSQLADHLWQSTLFVLGPALLALALKQNQARVRYWIWWIASVKFLIPFSLLVIVGGQLSWRIAPTEAVEPSASAAVIEQVARPFTSNMVWMFATTEVETPVEDSAPVLPAFVLAAWLTGCALMLLRWGHGWRRIRGLVRNSRQTFFMTEGREGRAWRLLERRAGLRRPLAIVSSDGAAVDER